MVRLTWKKTHANLSKGRSESHELRLWKPDGSFEEVGHVARSGDYRYYYFYARVGDRRVNTTTYTKDTDNPDGKYDSLDSTKRMCKEWVLRMLRAEEYEKKTGSKLL